jgi:hypothetical protein
MPFKKANLTLPRIGGLDTDTILDPVSPVMRDLQQIANLETGLPEKLWLASNYLNSISKKAAIPAMLGLRLLMKDKDKRDSMSNELSQISALLAAPTVASRTADLVSRVMDSSDKMRTLEELAPSSAVRSLSDLAPSIIYQLGKSL